jgi:DNA-binding CsgD family transcriptional regulator
MTIDERALALIDALYDAALDDTRWPDVLRLWAEVSGSQAATFWVLDSTGSLRHSEFEYINFDDAFIAEYLAHVAPLDPTVQYLVRHPDAPVVHDGLVIAERDKDRHAYYDWHGRHSDTRFRLVGQVCPAPGQQAGVALHRARSVGRYEAADIERFMLLHGHLRRALTIGSRLSSLGTLQRCTSELLDRNPAAVVLLDERGRVLYANAKASALASAPNCLRMSVDGVGLVHSGDDARLKRLVSQALSARGSLSRAGGAMRASRIDGERPYAIFVTPVSRASQALSAARPAVCVVISDPDQPRTIPVEQLRSTLGLTEAQARLVSQLTAGKTLRDAADCLEITYGTARARLAEIFQRTHTRRQSELVGLASTLGQELRAVR